MAVLCWTGAAKRLKDRDTWIGWDAVTCANRLKLVVQLRRFVVPEGARRPNLASRCLGLAYSTGAPLAMHTYSGEKNDCELPVSQTLLQQAAPVLINAVVTGDALHAQKKRR